MDFDSPDVAKEFPGLYMGDAGKTLNDPAEYEEDEKSKRKKDKKDSKKDKGYATLAGESSHEEEDLDPKSPGKAKKIKASFKLSAKKKDKKSLDKPDKEKEKEKEKDKSKKVEKEKKIFSDKERDDEENSKKGHDKEKKSLEKEQKVHIEKDKERHKEKDKKSVDKDKDKKSSDKEKDKDKKHKDDKKKKLSIVGGDKDGHGHMGTGVGSSTTSPNPLEKEKGLNLNLNQAINAFLNAPAPLLLKREKDHKKDKEGSSAASKVKLKLKRSKNSLEDSQSSQSDIPFQVSHQFPEEPDAIAKEIRKYETLLEQTHSHMKSSKKVSKKSEEQLWELQRTLTQLKRKLRSINALSVNSVVNVAANHSHSSSSYSQQQPISIPAALLPENSSATETNSNSDIVQSQIKTVVSTTAMITTQPAVLKEEEIRSKEISPPPVATASASAAASPTCKLSASFMAALPQDDDMKLDFTLKTTSVAPQAGSVTSASTSASVQSSVEGISVYYESENPEDEITLCPLKQEIDLNPYPNTGSVMTSSTENKLSTNFVNDLTSSDSNLASITPETEVERLQVEVEVHTNNSMLNESPSPSAPVLDTSSDMDEVDECNVNGVHGITTTSQLVNSIADPHNPSSLLPSSIIKTLTFSDEDDEEDLEDITDVSSLSVRNNYLENENSILENIENDGAYEVEEGAEVSRRNSKVHSKNGNAASSNSDGILGPFEMPVFETEEYLAIENEALIFFNEELQEEIVKEESEIDELMDQLEEMGKNGIDIDAPEIELDLDQFESDELVSLWQITKLENEALNEHVNHLRQMVAMNKLEEFRLEMRVKYLEEIHRKRRNCTVIPANIGDDEMYAETDL